MILSVNFVSEKIEAFLTNSFNLHLARSVFYNQGHFIFNSFGVIILQRAF